MVALILFLLSIVEIWILFTICFALAKKREDGEYLIDRKLAVYAIMFMVVVYFLINLRLFI